jgi:hypothetical protein
MGFLHVHRQRMRSRSSEQERTQRKDEKDYISSNGPFSTLNRQMDKSILDG